MPQSPFCDGFLKAISGLEQPKQNLWGRARFC